MSAPNTDLPEDDLDYVGGDLEDDDDDDDDSEDFVPGEDEVEEHHPSNDVDYDEEEEAVVPLLDGHLFYGTKHALHYQGEGFHLAASEAAPWNLLLASDAPATKSTTTTSTSCSLIMAGPCDFETAGAKATPRKLKVTFTLSHPPSHSTPHTAIAKSPNGDDQKPAARSTTAAVIQEHEDDDDQKKPSSSNSHSSKHNNKTAEIYYSVYGTQIDSHGGDLMEFMGGFFPPTTETEKVGLVCQVRMMAPRPSSSTQKASPVAAAAAARVQDDDDDDEEEDAQVDYDELIALHEDAGMSVADLKKRFGSKASASSSPDKKRKFDPKPPPPEDDEDDDDDYGF